MDKFIVMTMIRISGKCRTVKVIAAKALPYKRKEPAAAGPVQLTEIK